MQNHKVYLAKSNLASGLDFEYVKSNLLRIPNIDIIEYGQGYNPSDCKCLVYIHDDIKSVQEYHEIPINKNVFNSIEDFCSQHEDAINNVFVYLGKSYASSRDVEETTPFMIPAADFYTSDNPTWDSQGMIVLEEPEGICLLESVSYCLGLNSLTAWESNTRHYQPEEKYALPPLPTIEQRRSRGTSRNNNSQTDITISETRTSVSSPRRVTETSNSFSLSADEIIKSRAPKRRR